MKKCENYYGNNWALTHMNLPGTRESGNFNEARGGSANLILRVSRFCLQNDKQSQRLCIFTYYSCICTFYF